MLYERWQQIAQDQADQTALIELSSKRRWTFAQLAETAHASSVNREQVIYPRGHSAEFVISVLSGWKAGAVVCPLESDQTPLSLLHPPSGCVHLKTTSATTGAARAVAFTAAQLAADADNIVATMGLRPDWPNLGAISMAHSYGFSNLVLPLVLHGIPLILVPSPLPELIRLAAGSQPAVTLPSVPALWRAWHEAGAIGSNVRLAISAGAPLPVKLEQSIFAASGLKIHNFYGSSECGGIAFDSTAAPRTDDAFVGTPMRNVRLTLGHEGCLQVRGPAVAQSYWPNPSASLGDGCFETSDLAELQEGRVFLRGRVNDQINVAGRKVAAETIERVIANHPAVRQALVFGVPCPDPDRLETIVACLVPRTSVTAEELKQFLLSRLPAWQIPRDWWFVESLEANARGKLSRSEWRDKYIQAHKP